MTGAPGFGELRGPDAGPNMAVGSVRGLRMWALSGGAMHGSYGGTWVPGENEAVCYAGGGLKHDPTLLPAAGCGCGFWAYWKADDAARHGQGYIVGVIEGYGRTRIGTKGFRCQKARILGITITGQPVSTALLGTMLSRAYQVPVYPTLDELLSAHPVKPVPQAVKVLSHRWVPFLVAAVVGAAMWSLHWLGEAVQVAGSFLVLLTLQPGYRWLMRKF